MNKKINSLIIEKLGPLPDEVKTDQDTITLCHALDCDNDDNLVYDNYYWSNILLKQEQSRRELLAGLIEIAWNDYAWYCGYGNNGWEERFLANDKIKLIEKALSMKWSEIVSYLEAE